MRYIKIIFWCIIIFFFYCVFLWYQPKVGENIDYILRTNINEKLIVQVDAVVDKIHTGYTSMISWLDNPAPNTSSNIDGRQEAIRETKERNK